MEGGGNAADSTIITALCWVSRGFAKQVIDEYEPNPEDLKMYKDIQAKLDKQYVNYKNYALIYRGGGAEPGIKELAEEIERNLADMRLDKYD